MFKHIWLSMGVGLIASCTSASLPAEPAIIEVDIVPDPTDTVQVGKQIHLSVQTNIREAYSLIWSSRDTLTGTVTQTGTVTGVRSGQVGIVATIRYGSYNRLAGGSIDITVVP